MEFMEPREVLGKLELLGLKEDGIIRGLSSREGSGMGGPSSVKSVLLPARIVMRLGEARARASPRKVDRALKEGREQTS